MDVVELEDQIALLLAGATVEQASALAAGDLDPTPEQAQAVKYLRLGWDTAASAPHVPVTEDTSDPFEGLTAQAAS